MGFYLFLSLLFSWFFTSVLSHSWVECSDYRGNLVNWDANQCHGRPRAWANLTQYCPDVFGTDCGYNHTPQEEVAQCRTPPVHPLGSDYPQHAPMAVYNFGSLVTIAWPAKSHVAADCTNEHIPDNGLRVSASDPDPQRDPTRSEFMRKTLRASFTDVPHQNGVIDFEGYQNCPNFCVDQDKALCTGYFYIDQTLSPGIHTFQWFWESYPNEFYATCWEARVNPPNSADEKFPPISREEFMKLVEERERQFN